MKHCYPDAAASRYDPRGGRACPGCRSLPIWEDTESIDTGETWTGRTIQYTQKQNKFCRHHSFCDQVYIGQVKNLYKSMIVKSRDRYHEDAHCAPSHQPRVAGGVRVDNVRLSVVFNSSTCGRLNGLDPDLSSRGRSTCLNAGELPLPSMLPCEKGAKQLHCAVRFRA